MMRPLLLIVAATMVVPYQVPAADEPATATVSSGNLFENHFDSAEIGKIPKEFLVLEGNFTVQEVDGNKVLELPAEPLDSFGLLFGPSELAGIGVMARIVGESTKRTFPTFAVGLNGVSGFKLQVAPAKKSLDLLRGTEVKASVEYKWKSMAWTRFKLQVQPEGETKWIVQGKAWPDGEDEPKEWMVTSQEQKKPPVGRPSIWGTPYSGKKILFDDLVVYK
jgi:hypothetical protein